MKCATRCFQYFLRIVWLSWLSYYFISNYVSEVVSLVFHLSLKVLHKNFYENLVSLLISTFLETKIFITNVFMNIMSMPLFYCYFITVFKISYFHACPILQVLTRYTSGMLLNFTTYFKEKYKMLWVRNHKQSTLT